MSALVETNPTAQAIVAELHVQKNQVTCSSLDIAKHFDKQHKNVLQSISNLEASKKFIELNFQPSEFKDPTGRTLPCYNLTRDGFAFLCMGFTGAKAAAWKEAYIQAFNEMEQRLTGRGPKTPLEYRAAHIEQIEKLVRQFDTLVPYNDATRAIEILILQEVREAMSHGTAPQLLEDKSQVFKQMGLTQLQEADHPDVGLFWEHLRLIDLGNLDASKERGLMIIPVDHYFKAVKEMNLEPRFEEEHLTQLFKQSQECTYLGKRFHIKSKSRSWYFGYPVIGNGWIHEQLYRDDRLNA